MSYDNDGNWIIDDSTSPDYVPADTFLPSTQIGNGDQPPIAGLPSGTSASIIQQYINSLKNGGSLLPNGQQPGQNLANLGSLASSFATDQQRNRLIQGQLTQGYDKLMLDAQTGRNQTESDAIKKLAISKYLGEGGFHAPASPSTVTLNGKTSALPSLIQGPTGASDAQKAGAAALTPQLVSRLSPGGTYTPQAPTYATPGTAENIGQYAGLGLAGAGGIQNIMDGISGSGGSTPNSGGNAISSIIGDTAAGAGLAKTGINAYNALSGANTANTAAQGGAAAASGVGGAGGVMSTLTGKILPIAGIGLGGYQMLQNKGTLSNIMGGTEAGAGVGTLILPGVGTAIGAGIGALAGGVESLFNIGKPSAQELQGRSAHDYMNGQLASKASPAQMAEAQKAVQSGQWKDPKAAAALIVVRDTLIKSGLSPADAVAKSNQVMGQIANNVTSGASAVQSSSSPIQSIMNGTA